MTKKNAKSDYQTVIKEESNKLYYVLCPHREKWNKLNKGFWVWVEGKLMPTRHANKISRQKKAIEHEISSAVTAFYEEVEKSVYTCIDSAIDYSGSVTSIKEISPSSKKTKKKIAKTGETDTKTIKPTKSSNSVVAEFQIATVNEPSGRISDANKQDADVSISIAELSASLKTNNQPKTNAICDEAEYVIKKATLIKYVGVHTDIRIPDCVKTIGPSAFSKCNKLKSIEIPDSVTAIKGIFSNNPFYNCSSLQKIVLGKGITAIGEGMFYDLPIEEIIIPDSVTTIGPGAFSHCKKLKSIEIPDSVTEIPGTFSDNPFYGCSSLKEIILKGTDTDKLKQLKRILIKAESTFKDIIIFDN